MVTKEKQIRKAKVEELSHKMNGMVLLGEVLCFNARSETQHKHSDVVQALVEANIDPKYAREFLPRQAFSRACKKLEEGAVIDVTKRGQDYIKFQFTKKTMQNEEWTYSKETTLTLNTITGEITCPKQELKEIAQKYLDEATEVRTTSDITKIVQRLFEANGDLFPLRDQGGVYFVPQQFTSFIIQVDAFLSKLGGSISRFPVPAGTQQGDKSVQVSIADAFHNMILEHDQAIDQFSVVTRKDTLETAAEKIKATRVKIEAYAHLLQSKSKELLKSVEDANKKLMERVKTLATEKETAPKGPDDLFGHSVTKIIRWMGANNWTFQEAKKVMVEKHGFVMAESTIRGQLWVGSSGRDQWGTAAELTEKEVKILEKERK